MAFFRPNLCTTSCNHENRRFLVKCPLLKKCNIPHLVCLVNVVTITIGFSYSNISLLKKVHFLDLVCSVHVGTITTGCSHSKQSLLKMWHFLDLICAIHVETENRSLLLKFPFLKKWHFLDLLCSVPLVTIAIGISYIPSMFSTCSNHYNWVKLY